MSLQPGPQDPTDDNPLTPQGSDAEQPPPAPPAAPWQAAPPPASYPPPPPVDPQYGSPQYGAAPPGFPSAPPPSYGQQWGTPPPAAGYPTAGYPAAGYPAPDYQASGYAAPPQTDTKAVVALILAISSWVVCPMITAIIALIVAKQSDRAIAASGGRLEGRTMNTAARWIAWINIVLFALLIVAGIGLMAWVATQDPSTWNDIGNDTHF